MPTPSLPAPFAARSSDSTNPSDEIRIVRTGASEVSLVRGNARIVVSFLGYDTHGESLWEIGNGVRRTGWQNALLCAGEMLCGGAS